MQFLDGPTNVSIETVDRKIKAVDQYSIDFLAINVTSTNEFIGRCGLACDADRSAEISIVLHSKYHKQGYGLEVFQRLIAFGFSELHLRKIRARVNPANYGSLSLLKKNEFTYTSISSEDQTVPNWNWFIFERSSQLK